MENNKRVAFFIYKYTFGTSPAIINSILELIRNNFIVDVFAYKSFNTQYVKFNEKNVNLYNYGEITTDSEVDGLKQNIKSFLAKYEIIYKLLYTLLKKIRSFKFFFKSFNNKYFYEKKLKGYLPVEVHMEITNILKNAKYICFFGIDSFGLVFANCFEEAKRTPVIFYSLELYLADMYNFFSDQSTLEYLFVLE